MTRLILLMVMLHCAGVMLCGAPVAPLPVTGETVTLAPFVVEAEQCGFENWTKSVSKHFIVYTDLGGPEAAELLAKMELLRAATCQLMGGEPLQAGRMLFVFPSRDSDWSKLEHIGREQWRPGASAVGTPPARLCVVREFAVLRSLLFSDDESIHFFSILGMELAHQHGLPRQLWFDQGLGNLLKRAELTEDTLSIGRKQSGDATLRVHGLMPWLQFFKVRASSPDYYTKEGARIYIPQCALLLRHAFTHPDVQHRRHLEEWLVYLASGHEPTEESFRRIFGQDLAQWSEMMKGFLKRRTQNIVTLQVAKDSVDGSSRQLPLPVREMRELFLLVQVLNQQRAESVAVLDHLLAKKSISEPLEELLISACILRKNFSAARRLLQARIDQGTDNPLVFEEAGRQCAREYGPPSLALRLGEGEKVIRDHAAKALALEPRSSVAQSLLSFCDAFGAATGEATLGALRTRLHSQVSLPSLREHKACLAVALWRHGDLAEARRLCEELLSDPVAKDPTTALIEALRDTVVR